MAGDARALALVLAVTLVLLTGCAGTPSPRMELEMRPVLNFGFMPYNDPDHMRGLFDAVSSHLSEHLKVQMRFILAADYQTMGRLMDGQMVDIAWFTPASYRRIGKKVGAVAICKPFRRGRGTYRPVMLVRKNDPAKTLLDLKGRTMAYVERNSTSGFVVPNLMLLELGVPDPLAFFGKVEFTYGHQNSMRGVASGKFDACSVYEGLPEEMLPELGDAFKKIGMGPEVPNDPIAVRGGMEAATIDRIRDLMLTMERYESGRKALQRLNELERISGFVTTDDRDYRW